MSTRVDEPGWVAGQRALKADRICSALRAYGFTADDVAHLEQRDRREVEILAGVRKGSTSTWLLVADMMAGSVRAVCPFCGQGDPLGAPGPLQPYGHEGPCTR